MNRTCNLVQDCSDNSDELVSAGCALPTSAPVIQQIASAGPNSIVIVFSVIDDLSQRVQSYSFININTSIVQTVNASNLPPSVNTLNVTFTGLSTGVYYFFKGKAVNPSGDGPYSSSSGFMLQASGSVVTAFNVTVAPVTHFESNSVKISWSPPQTTGAADPSTFQYLVSYCELNLPATCVNSTVSSQQFVTLTNLKSATFYQYTVYLFSSELSSTQFFTYTYKTADRDTCQDAYFTCVSNGQCILMNRTCNLVQDCSDNSDELVSAGCALPTSAPVIQQIASAGPNSIVIVFSVIDDLSQRVQSYSFININTSIVQTVNASNLPPSVNTLNVTFTGLSTGVYYFFKGKAVNPSGDGPYSSSSGFMLQASGSVVTAFNVTVAPVTHFESNSVKISWSPPQTTGAADPSTFQYLVSYCELNLPATCVNSTVSSQQFVTLTNLKSATFYQYTVYLFSSELSSTQFFTYTYKTADRDTCQDAYFTCVSNGQCILMNRTCNLVQDCSDNSDELVSAGCALPTSAPVIQQIASAGPNSIVIVFSVIDDLSQRVQSYSFININTSIVQTVNASNLPPSVNTLNVTFTGLSTGVYYFFKGKAVNPSGDGPYSSSSGFMLQASGSVVTAFNVTVAPVTHFESNSVKISWSPPQTTGAADPSTFQYLVSYCELNLPATCVNSTVSSQQFVTLTNLKSATFYQYTVYLFSSELSSTQFFTYTYKTADRDTCQDAYFTCVSNGQCILMNRTCNLVQDCSDNSDELVSAGCALPTSAPVIQQIASAGPNSIVIVFSVIDDLSQRVQSYSFININTSIVQTVNASNLPPSVNTLNVTFTGLSTGVYYFFKGKAVNPSGDGPYSSSSGFMLQASGSVVTAFNVTVAPVTHFESNSVKISWSPPQTTGAADPSTFQYLVSYCELNLPATCVNSTVSSQQFVTLTNLKSATFYQYTVYLFSSELSSTQFFTYTYKTADRDTCQDAYFTCVSNGQCILMNRTCNLVQDCSDNSDELVSAGCALPTSAPVIQQIASAGPNSIVIVFSVIDDLSQRVQSYSFININTSIVQTVNASNLPPSVNTLNVTFTGLSTGVYYFFKGKAVNPSGDGPYSSSSGFMLQASGSVVTAFNVTVAPVTHFESNSVKISWSPPQTTGAADPSTFQYLVSYCELNLPATCVNSTVSSQQFVTLTNLKSATFYQYTVYLFSSELSSTQFFTYTYKTADRDTCQDAYFTCVSNGQCILMNRTCNLVQDCSDNSDELVSAGCALPTSAPVIQQIASAGPNSIVIVFSVIDDLSQRVQSYSFININTSIVQTVNASNLPPSVNTLNVTFTGLSTGVYYFFKGKAVNPSGDGPYSSSSGFMLQASGSVVTAFNVTVAPVTHFESNSVKISWSPPQTTGAADPSTFQYLVSYCELNLPATCVNSTVSSQQFVTLTNLKSATFYQYTVYLFSSELSSTQFFTYTYKTADRDTCQDAYFTCVSNGQCILMNRTCNLVQDCSDNSDELVSAGCALPTSAPVIQQIASAGPNSIVIVFSVIDDLSQRVQSYSFININTSIVQTVNASNLPPSVNTLNVTFTGLSTGVYYFFKGKAVNPSGDGPYSSSSGFMLQASGSVVTAFNVTVAPVTHFESNSVKISWSPPQTTGAADPSTFQYLVSYCELNLPATCVNSTVSSQQFVTLTNLKSATFYQYTVYLFSSELSSTQFFTYTYKTADRDTCQDAYFTCVSNGQCILMNRTCNLVQDCSDNSDELVSAGCALPTSAPVIQQIASAGPNSIVIVFSVIDDLSQRVQSYSFININTSIVQTVNASNLPPSVNTLNVTFTGLSTGVYYFFKGKAVNPSGDGPYSSSSGFMLQASGSVVTAFNVTVAPVTHFESNSVKISWSPPQTTGAADPSTFQYLVSYCELNLPATCVNSTVSSQQFVTLTNLKSATFYQYTVYLFSSELSSTQFFTYTYKTADRDTCQDAYFTCVSNGQCILMNRTCNLVQDCSDNSDELVSAGCALPTSAPVIQQIASAGPNSIVIVFSVIDDLSQRVQSYSFININTSIVQTVNASNLPPSVNTLNVTFTGLSTGVYYFFKGKAVNPSGDGPYSSSSGFMLQASGSVVTAFNVTVAPVTHFESNSVKISWSPPQTTGAADPSTFQYLVSYCELNLPATCVNSTVSSQQFVTLTNLKSATFYQYTVYLFSSELSSTQFFTYTYKTADRDTCQDAYFTCVSNGQCILMNRTCNLVQDCSDNSDELVSAGCVVPVNTPSNLHVVNTTLTSITIAWDAIKDFLEDRIVSYECQLVGASLVLSIIQDASDIFFQSTIFTGLNPDSSYILRVRALNLNGPGPWSSNVTVNTLTGVIGGASNIQVTPTLFSEQSSVLLSWSPPVVLVGYNASSLSYVATFCELNIPTTCQNVSLNSSTLQVQLTGLKSDSFYQYSLIAFATTSSKVGDLIESTFKTSSQATCNTATQFSCTVDKSCVSKDRLCDGVFDCSDKSDESLLAFCSLPTSVPVIQKFTVIDSNSIEITFSVIKDPSQRVQSYSFININTSIEKTVNALDLQPSVDNLSVIFGGLSSGVYYFFKGKAVNPSGDGPFSPIYTVKLQTSGLIGAVSNLTVVPVMYFESSSVKISWYPPQVTGNMDLSTFQYIVSYCEMNNFTSCVNSTRSSQLFVILTNLKSATVYQYVVYPFDTQMALGQFITNTFKTSDKDTCQDGYFTCVANGHCILKNKTCNLVEDCIDNSDELLIAGCVVPVNTPSNLRIINTTLTSITIAWDVINIPQDRITNYECQLVGAKFVQSIIQESGDNRPKEAIFIGLNPDSSYILRVRALNPSGPGPWSSNMTVNTMAGAIGKASNVKATPTLFSEQSSFILSWSPPLILVGYNASSLSYVATYCELNIPTTCQNISVNSSTLQVQLTGLKSDSFYQYSLIAFATTSSKVGDLTEGTFKTSVQNTCNPATQFTCNQDMSCVSKDRLCNGIFDCPDKSDESLLAACSLPKSAPEVKGSFIFDSNTIGIVFSVIKDLSQRIQYYSFVNINTRVVKVVDARNLQPSVDTLSVNFTGLSPGVFYYFKGKAVNPSGDGPYSSSYGAMLQSSDLYGAIVDVFNATVEPVVNFESSAVKVSWLTQTIGGEDPSTFQYLVSYCELNFTNCVNSTLSSQLSVNLTNLKSSTVYQYSIYVFYSQIFLGKYATSTFKTAGPIVGVFNASVVPVMYFESTAVNISWLLPETVSGVDPSTFQYLVSYCELNSTNITCVNSTLSPQLSLNLNNLKASAFYQYSVYVFYSGMSLGKFITSTFKTAEPIISDFNSTVVPIMFFESSAVNISWSHPQTLGGVNTLSFQYLVVYCENSTNITCVNSTLLSLLFVNLTNLKPSTVYQYYIYVYYSQNRLGKFVAGTFKTANKDLGKSDKTSGWTPAQKAAFSIGIIIIVSVIVGVSVYLYKKSRSDKGIINDPDNIEMS
ncbi:uncharacterized protein LOC101241241 isoform X2 [Hydra vulgaris]|uniref:Uncharacterized protein LOC101241241 isoform X2 n=1 Tax=Hydra vulgaris TaxID=6087 RepID=A0ABM4B650_HYDVU